MVPPLSDEDVLKKLTIPQLKLMCKERLITGHTKLLKAGIIAKLLDWRKQNGPLFQGPTFALSNTTSQISSGNVLGSRHSAAQGPDSIISIQRRSSNAILTKENQEPLSTAKVPSSGSTSTTPALEKKNASLPSVRQRIEVPVASLGNGILEIAASQNKSMDPLRVTPATPSKNPHDRDDSGVEKVAKKSKVLAKRFARPVVPVLPQNLPSASSTSTLVSGSGFGSAATLTSHSMVHPSKNHDIPAGIPPRRHRFKVLILDSGQKATTPSPSEKNPNQQSCLEFDPEIPIPRLKIISLPPSVVQRRHVPRLSLLLSSISLQDLKTCTLVSRLFRYSAYLAAYYQLLRTFPGARSQKVLSAYPSNVTNFWPYLSFRMNEVERRKSIYEASFLGPALKNVYGLSERLWTSPDDPKQAIVGIRFLITRLFFHVSLGYGGNMLQSQKGQYGVVLNAQEVIPHEIWIITMQSSSSIETYYVLEDTCEVIGGQEAAGILPNSHNLRADWSHYITARQCFPSPPVARQDSTGLLEHLQWLNHEEYSQGISKVWLSRIAQEGDVGSVKLEVARRYILACVVGNSISGPRLTTNQMQQEFNGLPKIRDNIATKSDRIYMFLPAHHHIESVHFTLSNCRSLHPGLAMVQTPGREYYILKDNGMQVGCEEDGVADVWMELLGCTNSGCI